MSNAAKILLMVLLALSGLGVNGQQSIVTILYSFAGTNGENPEGHLIEGRDGSLYGTTRTGGQYGYGTVYKMTLSGSVTTLYTFSMYNGTNGSVPEAPVIQGQDGNLYGTTQEGGGIGSIFSMTTNGLLNYSVVLEETNGANVQHGLVQGMDGNFYGITVNGGFRAEPGFLQSSMYGTVFKMTPSGSLSTLYSFGTQPGDATVGGLPDGELVQGPDGDLYGPADGGQYGSIYKATTNGVVTALFDFGATNGSGPAGPLVWGPAGNLFGLTTAGGNYGWGTIFELTTNGNLTSLFSFDGTNGAVYADDANSDDFPGGLVPGSDGNFYGETICGGPGFFGGHGGYENGTLFQITPGGTLSTLYAFGNVPNDGIYPGGGLMQASDGNFYGVTFYGGTNNDGTIFRLSVPLPAVFESASQSKGAISLTWSAVAGRVYQLQYATNFAPPAWANLGTQITASNGDLSESDATGPDSRRYYRVVLVQ
jgi:uncharacterized repeat protein (TIGR03803 family)